MRIERFEQFLDESAQIVDRHLVTYIEQDCPRSLFEAVRYALGLDGSERSMAGKRLRPALSLLVAASFDIDPRRLLPVAIGHEMAHNAALVKDDMIDGDAVRRGRPSVWSKYGIPTAAMIGDVLVSLTFKSLISLRTTGCAADTTLDVVARATRIFERMVGSQITELAARKRHDLTIEEYLAIAEAKTGELLAGALCSAARVAGVNSDELHAIEEFARLAMPVFQIADDVIDLSAAKGRNEIGCDVLEGKRSFLVVHTAGRCSDAEREAMFAVLDKPRDAKTRDEVAFVIGLFHSHCAVDAAREAAGRRLAEACRHLASLPADLQHNLGCFVAFLDVSRMTASVPWDLT